ncbi:MAG TPA: hypothetical protein VNO30_38525 [Kofleriaceae bacterium]|nr:hypothetical protein [Kofleriaceae bacterium]
MGTGSRADINELTPAAISRRDEIEDRHRALARALHADPATRAPQITEKLEGLRAQIEQFRARAVDLHAKLVELESKGDSDVRALRSAMMASVVRIEGVVRALMETPDPTAVVAAPPARFPDGTRAKADDPRARADGTRVTRDRGRGR